MPKESTQKLPMTSAPVSQFTQVPKNAEIEIGEIEKTINENRGRPLSGLLKGVIETGAFANGRRGRFHRTV
jgi:hypothetical protein